MAIAERRICFLCSGGGCHLCLMTGWVTMYTGYGADALNAPMVELMMKHTNNEDRAKIAELEARIVALEGEREVMPYIPCTECGAQTLANQMVFRELGREDYICLECAKG